VAGEPDRDERMRPLAASPATWRDVELPDVVGAFRGGDAGAGHGLDELTAHDGELLRRLHRLTREAFGAPADTAASFLAIWSVGALANAVGATWALADAGLVVDPRTLRLLPGADAPITGVRLGSRVAVVGPDHPWAAAPGAQVVVDRDQRRDLAVRSLVAAAEPVVEALHRCVRVGRAGLWNQVGDGLVDWLAYRAAPPDVDVAAACAELARAPARRWKATAVAWPIGTAAGPAIAVQKGGCCLEYRFATAEHFSGEDGAAYLRAFPVEAGERVTCGTCSLRARADAAARQRFWIERRGPS